MNLDIQQLIHNLKNVNLAKPWYGSGFNASIKEYNTELLSDKSLTGKSILEIALHLVSWRAFVLAKLDGDANFDIVIDAPLDWPSEDGHSWEDVTKKLDESLEALITRLVILDDSLLSAIVPGKSYTFRYMLDGLIYHDVYHLGQMNLIHSTLSKRKRND